MVLAATIADKYEMNEHNISKERNPAELISQECVEDTSKISKILRVSVRNFHKRSEDGLLLIFSGNISPNL